MQGNVGVGQAIAYYTAKNYVVSLPLNDSQGYDLIVDDGSKLLKVQVKTSTYKNRYGTYEVELRTKGGNRSRNTSKALDKTASDLLFIWCDDGSRYEMETAGIDSTSRLCLGLKFAAYKI